MVSRAPARSYAPVAVLKRDLDTGRPLTVRLATGHRGEYQRRRDDCFRCCVAMLAGCPAEDAPDPQIDARLAAGEDPDAVNAAALEALEAWLADRGLQLTAHAELPTHRGAWIGISPAPGRFNDHTVVMCEDRLVFDPASNWPCPPGHHVAPPGPITAGLTIDPLETP